VSIVTHLMGFGNLDLALRETRAVTTGPLYIIRIGTCGSLNGKVGQVHVPSRGSVAILRDPDAFLPGSDRDPYRITEPLLPDGPLTAALLRELRVLLGNDSAFCMLCFTGWHALGRYTCQGQVSLDG
jgi:uridine phosphorylase